LNSYIMCQDSKTKLTFCVVEMKNGEEIEVENAEAESPSLSLCLAVEKLIEVME